MSKDVLKDILEWSASLPDWQRDALRLMAMGDEINIEESANLCLAEVGFPFKDLRAPEPLSAVSITSDRGDAASVALRAIRKVENVNALRNGAKLEFPVNGLVAIYGENGTGKSGFARILKDSCRCSAQSQKIRGNVYSHNATVPISATIDYRVGTTDKTIAWMQGVCPEELQAVTVFDSSCAPVYVNKENAVAFAPFGLNLLPRLADLCDNVSDNIKQQQKRYTVTKLDLSKDIVATTSGQWYSKLKLPITEEELNQQLSFDEATHGAQLRQLTQALAQDDPERIIKDLTSQSKRMTDLKERLEKLASNLGPDSMQPYAGLINECIKAQVVADLASETAFKDALVPGGGGPPWKHLWEAARSFVAVAYPGAEYPAGAEIERCPLCQQGLPEDVRTRLQAFEAYVKAEAAKHLQETLTSIDESIRLLNDLPAKAPGDTALLEELQEPLSTNVKSYLEEVAACTEALINSLKAKKWCGHGGINQSPLEGIGMLIDAITNKIRLQQDATDPEKRERLRVEALELRARQTLHENASSVRLMIKNMRTLAALEKANTLTKSRKITEQSDILTDKYLTDEVKKVFTERLADLFEERTLVSLEKTRSGKGTAYFQVKLVGTVVDTPVAEIVSEGEFRAIALAGFLAELDLAPQKNAVVFDDPVSSLDHKRRKKIAQVLAGVAKDRQLIVFTHDLYFLAQLLREAKDKVDTSESQLRSYDRSFGHVLDGTPMSVKSFSDRATSIETRANAAKKHIDVGDIEPGDDAAYRAGSLMRQLCEHCVEKILFGGVILRFDEAVHTNCEILSKHQLLNIESSDIDLITGLMSKYSNYVHDKTPADDVAPPDPSDVLNDLNTLRAWKSAFMKKLQGKAASPQLS